MPDPARFTRGFKLVFPDGFELDGAQFPSGRCVLDLDGYGLVGAAISIENLAQRRPGDRIVWADEVSAARQPETEPPATVAG